MATITQRLAFLISANADQAVKAFDKTAATAEKQMRKAGNSIDKLGIQMTKFGAAGLAAAGTLGGALTKLAQGAIEDQKAQALLAEQLRKTTGATDGQIKQVEQLIDATARATGFTDDQLRPAMANLVRTFGDTEKASKVLATALDLSRATGRDLEAVTIALGRAASGSTTGLSRMGIVLDDATKKSKDFDTILAAVNAKVGGQAAAYAETYAGKMERAKVAISEAGEQIGSAFIPVLEKSATALSGTINALSNLDQKTGGAIGKFATFGTVGLGVVSTASLVTGQLIKLRDRFGEVDAETGKFTGSLTRTGKIIAGASAALGIAAALYADYASTKARAEQVTRELADALRLEGDAQKSAVAALLEGKPGLVAGVELTKKLGVNFAEVADKTSASSKRLDELSKIVSAARIDDLNIDLGKMNRLLGPNVELTRDQAFQLAAAVEWYVKGRAAIEEQAAAQQTANDLLNENIGLQQEQNNALDGYFSKVAQNLRNIKARADMEKMAKDASEESAKQTRQLAVRQNEAAAAAEKFKQKVIGQADALKTKLNGALSAAQKHLDDMKASYNNLQSQVSGAVTGTLNLALAQSTASQNAQAIADAQTKVNEEQAKLNALLANGKADEADVAQARQDLADATTALNTALKAPVDFLAVFKDQETAAKTFAGNIQKLLDLNADRAVVDQLVSAGADTGNAIATAILGSADPAAKVAEINGIVASTKKIADDLGTNAADKYFSNGVSLAQNLVNGMNSVLKKAEIKLTWKGLNKDGKPLRKISSLTDLFQSQITGMFQTAGVTEDIPQLADGGIVRARRGGTLALLGEGGRDEAVIPLPANGGGAGTTIQVTVNAGMGADGTSIGRQIVDELVAYQRRVGALPIKVAG